jgi:hypothetical protein
MAETRRNLHQLLKGKQLYCALYRGCTGVPHDLATVLEESAAKGDSQDHPYCTSLQQGVPWAEKTKAETFRQRRQKNQEISNNRHGSKRLPAAVEGWSCHPELLLPSKVSWNTGWPWRRRGWRHRASAASGREAASHCTNLSSNLEAVAKATSSSVAPETGPELLRKYLGRQIPRRYSKWQAFAILQSG